MIVPRLRSEARGGASTGASTRYSSVYGNKVSHGQHNNDPDLKRALQYSYTSQAVRKWEKRWVVIHETSMRVHKWMPAPQTVTDKLPTLSKKIKTEQQQQQQLDVENTQMLIDDDSTNQSSQN